MFIKKKIYKTACKETWSVAKPGVATDYAGHTGFFWQESVLLFHSRPKASTNFQPDLVFQRLTWLGPSRPFCSSEIHKYRPTSSYHAVPVGRRNKMLERTLATLNASSPTMSHALEKTKAARRGVICKSASSKLSASCLHGYSVSIGKLQSWGCLLQKDLDHHAQAWVYLLPVRVSNVTWCWGWLLGLRTIGPSSFTHFCFKTCFKTKHWEMQTTNTFAQSCNNVFPPNGIATIAMSWACRSDENIKRYHFDPHIP